MLDPEKPDTFLYISSQEKIFYYHLIEDTFALIYNGLPGEHVQALSNGSLLAGTTTGFYTIFVEPWDDIIVKGNTEYKSADNEISIFPNLVT